MKQLVQLVLFIGLLVLVACNSKQIVQNENFRAGAARVDISPITFPVIINGYFWERLANSVTNSVFSKSIVLDGGNEKLAIVVVDNLFIPRDFMDEAKKIIENEIGIKTDRILISATHTHTAPSLAAALNARADSVYLEFLLPKIVESVKLGNERLQPAKIGWGVTKASDHTHCRRWIVRPEKMLTNVFDEKKDRANMHPGYQNSDFISPSGPADPDLSVISVRSVSGKPIAVFANFSMHFCGSSPVCSDYFGQFANYLSEKIDISENPDFVAIMSQGTSGDLHWNDYSGEAQSYTITEYGEEMAAMAFETYKELEYKDNLSIKMKEEKILLNRRTPDENRLKWAKNVVENMNGSKAPNEGYLYDWKVMIGKTKENEANVRQAFREVYALEQIHLAEKKERELKLQVIQIGDLALTAIPCEVYGITGLKLKAQSPYETTINITLANGAEGYIPPPEQHELGGYTTWLSSTTSLEVQAEPKILEAMLLTMEELSGKSRKPLNVELSSYDKSVLRKKPLAYWLMNEMSGKIAKDFSGNNNDAKYDGKLVYFLDGPDDSENSDRKAIQFIDGKMLAEIPELGNNYSVEFWFYNALPPDVREYAGFIFSDQNIELGIIGGNKTKLQLEVSNSAIYGESPIKLKEWNHISIVKNEAYIEVYLNDKLEIKTTKHKNLTPPKMIFGARSDGQYGLNGRICNVAVFNR